MLWNVCLPSAVCESANDLAAISCDLVYPRKCAGERRGSSPFVFNSFASLCRKYAAGGRGFVIIIHD